MKWIIYKWAISMCCIIMRSSYALASAGDDEQNKQTVPAQVEVRAVFINCEPNNRGKVSSDNEATRFEREEFFKHSALRDCCNKLAVTVKIASEPNDNSGDEYLPIEHVFEGTNKKRVRLLNPYILRLRRELPLQAYKIRKVDTVTGILTNSDGEFEEKYKRRNVRMQRDLAYHSQLESSKVNSQGKRRKNFPTKTLESQWNPFGSTTGKVFTKLTGNCGNQQICMYRDGIPKSRDKRNEHNIVVEDSKQLKWTSKDNHYHRFDRDLETIGDFEESSHTTLRDDSNLNINSNNRQRKPDKKYHMHTDHKNRRNSHITYKNPPHTGQKAINRNDDDFSMFEKSSTKSRDIDEHSINTKKKFDDKPRESESDYVDNVDPDEKDYELYEIGNPEVWYSAQLQLFEKLSTPEGKTLWNDLTKGEQASVSSLSPEWMGQDLNVKYRPGEWLPRDQYTLPAIRLCLLTPIRGGNTNTLTDNVTSFNDGEPIVVPAEDILDWQDDFDVLSKRNDKYSEREFTTVSTEENEQQGNRKVIVRTSRALLKGGDDKVNLAMQGIKKYLTLPHRRLHRAQIDVEARADENELIRVGATGRISTAVADSTRRTRTVIMVQATNTGLAAARYRVAAQDCGPVNMVSRKGNSASVTAPMLLPPRHTRSLRLELPDEIPLDTAHCAVVLMNEEDESVAVRDVLIKKGDRCFCVWHCDCVCLSNDPKLLCREMAVPQQAAAGLSTRDRSRHSRSICYTDNTMANLVTVVLGVISTLLFLGFIKACLGLVCRCGATWGLHWLLQSPRKLERYYEKSLAGRPVEYDEEGWPIHPDNKTRTVHLVSWPMEFMLNLIIFVTLPCILIQDGFKKCFTRCFHSGNDKTNENYFKDDTKKCFSSHDIQSVVGRWRRRRGGLRRWMTPEAQELSADIWQNGLSPKPVMNNEFMQPLLLEQRGEESRNEIRESGLDSEQDDTEYVLTQMQKSRESLSKNQREHCDPEH